MDWIPYLITVAVVVVLLGVAGWWLDRRSRDRLHAAMVAARDARAAEYLLGWGDGSDPAGTNPEGINAWDDVTPDCVDCGGPDDE